MWASMRMPEVLRVHMGMAEVGMPDRFDMCMHVKPLSMTHVFFCMTPVVQRYSCVPEAALNHRCHAKEQVTHENKKTQPGSHI
jgi:hypothetical protein